MLDKTYLTLSDEAGLKEVMRRLVPKHTLTFVAESIGVLKDLQTSHTNLPKAKVFLGIACYRQGDFVSWV